MASNLLAMASNLIGMASNLLQANLQNEPEPMKNCPRFAKLCWEVWVSLGGECKKQKPTPIYI